VNARFLGGVEGQLGCWARTRLAQMALIQMGQSAIGHYTKQFYMFVLINIFGAGNRMFFHYFVYLLGDALVTKGGQADST